jgi:hypothetical protein
MTLHQPDHPPLTVEALIAWLRQKPADETYVWSDPVFCLVGHYLSEHNSSWGVAQYSDIPDYEQIAGEKPWTFGAALGRAEKLLALPAPDPADVVAPPTLELQAEPEREPEPAHKLTAPFVG